MSRRPDSQIAARLRSARLHTKHERIAERVVVKAMTEWLDSARYLLLREVRNTMPGLTAASYPPPMQAIDAIVASYNTWRQQTETNVLPAIGVAFGEAFQQVRRGAEYSTFRWEQAYLAEVSDRLKIWPEGAMEELRPELLEALAEAEDYNQIVARVGRILNIDAASGALRADINWVDKQLMDPLTDPADMPILEARRRALWQQHDEALGEWQWKARRIARTEIHGAVEGGRYAAARAVEIATGDPLWRRWLSTDDERTRVTHRVADGQTVKLSEPYRVGGFLLMHPGDPITIAPHETINCRCTSLYMDYDELQDELQGPDGSMGEIRPGGIRIGPDDPDAADEAIAALAEETRRPKPARARGEDHGQTMPELDTPVEADPEHVPEKPLPDLSGLSDSELTEAMFDAEDDELYEYLAAEADRRADIFEDEEDKGEFDDEETEDLEDDLEELDEDPELDDLGDLYDEEPDATADELDDPIDDDPFAAFWTDPTPPPGLEPVPVTGPETRLDELLDELGNATDDADVERILADIDAEEVKAARRAAAQERRDAAKAAEWDEISRLVDDEDMDHEQAVAQVMGLSIEQQRRQQFIAEARANGFSGRSFEELVTAAWHFEISRLWVQLEDETRHSTSKYGTAQGYSTRDLFFINDNTADKVMSEDAARWFEAHGGRLTKSVFRDRILSGGVGDTDGRLFHQ